MEEIKKYEHYERWRCNPSTFVEEFFGIKLMKYQKFFLDNLSYDKRGILRWR